LLLYLELGFRITCSDLWSYGDSNPRPLACHQQAGHPPQSICAAHRPRTCMRVRPDPGRLRYFPAVLISPARMLTAPQPAGRRPAKATETLPRRLSATRHAAGTEQPQNPVLSQSAARQAPARGSHRGRCRCQATQAGPQPARPPITTRACSNLPRSPALLSSPETRPRDMNIRLCRRSARCQ
jgi:hypothetical protein